MITVVKSQGYVNSTKKRLKMFGLENEKPIGTLDGVGIANGSIFVEVDTGKTQLYDEQNNKWTVSSSSGGVSYDLDGDGIDDTVATDGQIEDITDSLFND